eukprot:TRINITY_DN20328_c0_g1_i2.p1 TRINITY_DN20328_c0_g1~~TRINITY_DN20328_c0_g1_i2.p1  ORF type:complete len:247 (+),score=38.46 TRINITY_DN20328_c0_g1_i2:286-1026(+)
MVTICGSVMNWMHLLFKLLSLVVLTFPTCPNGFAFYFSVGCNVALVYLRSQVLFQSSKIYMIVMKILLTIFYIALTILLVTILMGCAPSAATVPSALSSILVLITLTSMAIIDVLSTVGFGWYVYSVNSRIRRTGHSMSPHLAQTDLIAKRSCVICFLVSVGVSIFWQSVLTPQPPVDIMDAGTFTLIAIDNQAFLMAFVLWMRLKMEIDNDSKKSLVNASGEHLLRDFQSKAEIDLQRPSKDDDN